MKNVMMICLSLFFVLSGVTNAKANAEGEDNDKYAYVTLEVKMDCGKCADKVKTQLSYTKGVKDVKTDYVKNEVTVKYLKKKCTVEDLKESLSEINYSAKVKGEKACCSKQVKSCCGSSSEKTEHKPCGSGTGCGGH